MASTLKKCLKLHKLFANEVARSARLESDGAQVLSSLANVSQRLPTLLQPVATSEDVANDVDDVVMGVLSYSSNSRALLLQKHFLALEKSSSFLTDILRDYQELLRHLRSYAGECVTLVDDALVEVEAAGNDLAVTFPLQLSEWMDTVLAMFEHEVLRKTRLVAELEYSDVARLAAVHKHWSARGAFGNVDHDYGLQLPKAKLSVSESAFDSHKSKKNKKKKNKK